MPRKMRGPVIIVEDESSFREAFTRYLERNGFAVMPYRDGREAVSDIQNGLKYKALFVDYELSSWSHGTYVIEESLKANPSASIFILSGYISDELKETYKGKATMMTKGRFKVHEILETLNRCNI